MTDSTTDKIAIRQQIRNRRSALPAYRQRLASFALARRVLFNVPALHRTDRIAFYLAQDGEIDLLPLMLHCIRINRRCYLPVLGDRDEKKLSFAEWSPGLIMAENRYGIPEPAVHSHLLLPASDMGLIFMPLVAFDDRGNRLGMGGGYYDYTLAEYCNTNIKHRNRNRHARQCPVLVATAHDIQHVSKLPRESWDIIPDITITPGRIIRPNRTTGSN
jgi:5-formyltetrahydrofolate cyclo-ligase